MDWALRYRGVLLPPAPEDEEPRLLLFWLVLSRLVVLLEYKNEEENVCR